MLRQITTNLFTLIGKSATQKGGETERITFHLLIHSPSGHNGLSWADFKPGGQSCFWFSHTEWLWPSTIAFPCHKKGAGWDVRLLGLEQSPIWNPATSMTRTLPTRLLNQAQLFAADQFPICEHGNTEDVPSAWVPALMWEKWRSYWLWLLPGPDSAFVVTWRGIKQMEISHSNSPSFSITLPSILITLSLTGKKKKRNTMDH